MQNTHEKVEDYRGFEIVLDRKDYTFRVDGEDFTREDEYAPRSFQSLAAAKGAIDRHHTEEAKVEAKAIKLALKVFDAKGDPITITGFHRATGKAKIEDAAGNKGIYEGDHIFPAIDWVGFALRRMKGLQEEIHQLGEKLHKVNVRIGSSYDRQIAADRYPGKIKQLMEQVAAAERKAIS